MMILAVMMAGALCSCSSLENEYVQGEVGWWSAATPGAEGSTFGLLFSRPKPVLEEK